MLAIESFIDAGDTADEGVRARGGERTSNSHSSSGFGNLLMHGPQTGLLSSHLIFRALHTLQPSLLFLCGLWVRCGSPDVASHGRGNIEKQL